MTRMRTCSAAAVLALGPLAGQAQAAAFQFEFPYLYETSSITPAAPGTPASLLPLGSASGGLCVPGSAESCPSLGPSSVFEGPLVGGLIQFTTPTISAGAHYLLTLSVADDPHTLIGDIFAVVLDGSFLGTTSVTGIDDLTHGHSAGLFEKVIMGGTHTIGITNLLQQYSAINAPNTLPGLLGDATLNSGPVPSSYNSALLNLTAILTPAPEPASLVVLGTGALLLGAVRRRPRQ